SSFKDVIDAQKQWEGTNKRISEVLYALNSNLLKVQREFYNVGTAIEIGGITKLSNLTTKLRGQELNQGISQQIQLLTKPGENLQNLFKFNESNLSISNKSQIEREQLQGVTGKEIFGGLIDTRKDITSAVQDKLSKLFQGDEEQINISIGNVLSPLNKAFDPFIGKLKNGDAITGDLINALIDTTNQELKRTEQTRRSADVNSDEKGSAELVIKELEKLANELLKIQRTFNVTGKQISLNTSSEKALGLRGFKGGEQLIAERFKTQQTTSEILNNLDIDNIKTQATLARQQIGARPEEKIRLENQGKLIENASTLLTKLIQDRPEFKDSGLTVENLNTKIPELIDSSSENIDKKNKLLEFQQNYNHLKEKQAELQRIAIDNEKLESVFAEERLNIEIKYNQERARKGDFGAVRGNLGNTFFEANTFSSNDFWSEMSNNTASFGKEFKQAFKDGFAEAATGSTSLNEAFRNIGLTISKNILTKASNLAVDTAFGLLLGNNSVGGGLGLLQSLFNYITKKSGGGIIKKYAGGGYVIGGSGNKDDVPALLNNGEFVLNKTAAQKIGKNRLDILNSVSDVPSAKAKDILNYVPGYAADISLANEFYGVGSRTRPTAGELNTSKFLSAYGLTDENNPQNALKFTREKYFTDLKDYQKHIAESSNDFEKQQMTALYMAYINAGINAVGSLASKGKISGQGLNNAPKGTNYNYITNKAYAPGSSPYFGNSIGYGKAMGGNIRGNNQVPAYLMGGEYVFSKQSANRIGLDNLYRMNSSGKVPRFQDGGYVGNTNQENNTNNTNTTSNPNNFAISTTININDGKVNSNVQSNSNNKDNKNSSINDQTAKQLSNLINSQVTQILLRESRPNGILDSKYKSR
ncbi:MAG: hypothetical protein Q7R95_02295, partial [bacterium]|nr:hypothetical protein [bacterium]